MKARLGLCTACCVLVVVTPVRRGAVLALQSPVCLPSVLAMVCACTGSACVGRGSVAATAACVNPVYMASAPCVCVTALRTASLTSHHNGASVSMAGRARGVKLVGYQWVRRGGVAEAGRTWGLKLVIRLPLGPAGQGVRLGGSHITNNVPPKLAFFCLEKLPTNQFYYMWWPVFDKVMCLLGG